MRVILFLSRIALVCNFFFLLVVLLHFFPFLEEQVIVSTVVIIGYALAVFFFTPLVATLCLACLLLKKKIFDVVPKWLVITNFIFLFLQILYIILFLNGSFYS
jgi:hypothetical protein